MSELTSSNKTKRRLISIVLQIIYFVVFLVLTTFLEGHDQLELSHSSCDAPSGDPTPPLYAPIYSAFLNWMGNDTASQVSVIAIKAELEDIQQNLCRGRRYMADLIQALATQHPSAIVIDKYFSPNACLPTPGSTDELANVVRSVRIPVIVGESTDIASMETDNSCLVQKPQLDFGSSNVHRGLLRLNANREQIPLRWNVLPQQPSVPGIRSVSRDSLSLVTVAVVAPQLVSKRSFQSLLSGARQPYARIGPELSQETSTELLCSAGTDGMRQRWSLHCSPNEQKMDLLGKVVVIGAENEVDHWAVLGRPMWGFQLQALYIDALLSGHYLRAPPGKLTVWLFFGFLIALEGTPVLIEWLHFHRQWRVRYFFRDIPWVSTLSLIFVGLTVLCFVLMRYLPPLLMLFGVLTAFATKLVFAGSKYVEHLVLPEKRN